MTLRLSAFDLIISFLAFRLAFCLIPPIFGFFPPGPCIIFIILSDQTVSSTDLLAQFGSRTLQFLPFF
jgi:hypothetical protein